MKTKQFLLGAYALVILMAALLVCPAAAQEGGGFTDTFDDASLQGWEHGQDVIVENGVLRLSPGAPVFRIGRWTLISLQVRARFAGADCAAVIHYHATDQGSYNLHISPEMVTLEKASSGGAPIPLGQGSLTGVQITAWTDIAITLSGGQHKVTISGQEILSANDAEILPPGAVGFVAVGGAIWELDSVTLNGTNGEPASLGEPLPSNAPPLGEVSPVATSTPAPVMPASLIDEFFSSQANPLELSAFAINLALAALCAFVLGLVYVQWGSALTNRRKFATNFMFITVTTTFIILVVRSSVALSLGLVGALSITRFRTAIKEPEELAYLFVAIGMGIGLGDNQRLITLLTLLAIILLAGFTRLIRRSQADVNLHLNLSAHGGQKLDINQVMQALAPHCSKVKLLRFDENADVVEISCVVEFRHTSNLSQARAALLNLSPQAEISFLDNRGIW